MLPIFPSKIPTSLLEYLFAFICFLGSAVCVA